MSLAQPGTLSKAGDASGMAAMGATADAGPGPTVRPIKPRNPDLPIDAVSARHWALDNVLATALIDSVSMLFPAGERFFVRSVHHYLNHGDRPLPPELRAQIGGFFAQEGRHAQQHERVNHLLDEQGYDVRGFLRFYEWLCYQHIEKAAPPSLSLAVTAAAEHFTAIMADNFLRMDELTSRLDPTMRRLLLWHAAEEIEHKAVAFDVLRHVNPSYALRVSGLALASLLLGTFWLGGACMLLWQESRMTGFRRILSDVGRVRAFRKARGRRGILVEVFARGISEYLRRDFHPNDHDNYDLAAAFLQGAGMN